MHRCTKERLTCLSLLIRPRPILSRRTWTPRGFWSNRNLQDRSLQSLKNTSKYSTLQTGATKTSTTTSWDPRSTSFWMLLAKAKNLSRVLSFREGLEIWSSPHFWPTNRLKREPLNTMSRGQQWSLTLRSKTARRSRVAFHKRFCIWPKTMNTTW